MSLQDKNIIVTGGSRGIGRAIVELFISKGANVIFTYFENDIAAKNIEELSDKYSGKAKACQVDIKDYRRVKQFLQEILLDIGSIDVLVNNAGIRKDKSLLYMEEEEWNEVIQTNLTGVFYMTRSIIPYMLTRRRGRIVNISSISGISGLPGQTNYSSSKAGIIGFTKALAKETAPYGISINAIAPGPVETEMLGGLPKAAMDKLLINVPIKRMCTPNEVAMMANVMVDEELSPWYLTGQVISLDGGMS